MFRILALLSAFLPASVGASELSQTLRPLLLAHDFATLEKVLSAEQSKAVSQRDHQALRLASREVFSSTDPQVLAATKAWVEAEPNSGQAWAAFAGAQFWRARAISLKQRHYPAGPMDDRRNEMMLAAQDAALQAHRLDPSLARPVEIIQSIFQDGWRNIAADKVFEEFAAATADRGTLVAAARAFVTYGRGGAGPMYELCSAHAKALTGYSADLCMAEAILTSAYDFGLNKEAAQVMAEAGDLGGPFARVAGFLELEADPDDLETALQMHRLAISEIGNVKYWTQLGSWLAGKYSDPFYSVEMRQRSADIITEKLQSDPHNPWLFKAMRWLSPEVTGVAFDHPLLDKAAQRDQWLAAMAFGWNDPEMWQEGARYAGGTVHDLLDGLPYHENAAVFSGNDPYYLSRLASHQWMIWTGEAPTRHMSKEEAHDALQCPMLRSIRLYVELCKSDEMFHPVCDRQLDPLKDMIPVMEDPAVQKACPEIARAGIRSLAYKVPKDVEGWDFEKAVPPDL